MRSNTFTLRYQEIEKLCKSGESAPSGGNAQPWSVVIDSNRLFIKLDPKRSENFLDVGHYASFFGVGCFLQNLTIEAQSLGLSHKLEIHDFKTINDPLVTIHFQSRKKPGQQLHPLQPYIEKRITNRHIYDGTTIEETKIITLKKLIKAESGHYHLSAVSTFKGKEDIADQLGHADAIRMVNGDAYKEMMSEFRWTEGEVIKSKDGLDIRTLELPKNAEKLYGLLRDYPFLRSVLPEKALTNMARPLLIGCSHICCLYTSQPVTPKTMIIAGSLFERLWLTTTKLDISLQPWSIIPFFLIRKNLYNGKGFSQQEVKILNNIEKNLSKLFSYSLQHTPLFIFRLSITEKSPSAHSLRIPWQNFTKISNI